MNQPWWAYLLKSIIFSVLFFLLISWINRGLKRGRIDKESETLQHEKWIGILGAVGVIFFLGLAIISNTVGKNATTSIWSTAIFVGGAALSLPLIADYLFSRHSISKEGLHYGGMFGKRGFMEWESVQRVSISPSMCWFLLETSSGAKARISFLLEGLTHFANMILENVPRERIETEAFQLLMQKVVGSRGIFIDPDSIEWKNALSKAHSTLTILRELCEADAGFGWVKYGIKTTEGTTEHVWGELQFLGEDSFSATLETPPVTGKPFNDMTERLPLSALDDWMVMLPDGSVRGAFTIQVELEIAKREGLPVMPHIAAMDGRFRDR